MRNHSEDTFSTEVLIKVKLRKICQRPRSQRPRKFVKDLICQRLNSTNTFVLPFGRKKYMEATDYLLTIEF